MQPIYAIGDIHGQKDMLDSALSLIAADGGVDSHIVFLGDYVDRGPDSRGVIDTLIAGKDAGLPWTFLAGNHDRMFTRFIREGRQHDPRVKSGLNWLNPRLGGAQTLQSYGVRGEMHFADHTQGDLEKLVHCEAEAGWITPAALIAAAQSSIPETHLTFLENLPLWHSVEDLLCVHAGLRPGIPLHAQDPEDLIWIREGFLDSDHDFGPLVVHGHTALDHPLHFGTRVDLDGGAGYGRPLVPAVFEGRDCWTLTDAGRVPLLA